jgi:hypothetical protein
LTEREDFCGKHGLVTSRWLWRRSLEVSYNTSVKEGEGLAQRGSGTPAPALPARCDPFKFVPGPLNAFGFVLWVDGNVSSHGLNGGHIEEL